MNKHIVILATSLMACFTLGATVSTCQPVIAQTRLANENDTVSFNTRSKKYHILSCMHVKNCTHCIDIKRSEAKKRGGVPCKSCGAGET